MKKFFSALCIITFLINTSAFAGHIYTYSEEVPISKSVTLTKVNKFYSDYNIQYSVIKADLTDADTSLKLLTPEKGIDKLDTVQNLAKTEENVVGAINADFFSWYKGSDAFSLGMEIKDGKLVSSPINPSTMATISYMNDTLSMSYLDFHIMAVAPNGEYKEIRHLNKHTSYYGDILMYTSEFGGGFSPAPGGEVVEVVVSEGVVKEFRRNLPPVEIPKDGCVLVVSEGSTMFLANNFQVGDPIKFDYYMTPYLFDAQTAFGGGAMLVHEGKAVTSYSHTVAGNHPRSAIGTDKEGKTLYLVAVDGRQDVSLGMRMSTLANLMIELGCYTAVNLDGGGSTNMVASTVTNGNIHTVNSPSENRAVINAVGVTYSGKGSQPSGIILEKESDSVFIGDSVNFSASVYDENMRPIASDITWSSDKGNVAKGIFTPSSGGFAKVTASTGGISQSDEIFVIDKISGIECENYLRLSENSNASLGIKVFDSDGHYAAVTNTKPFEIVSSDPSVVAVTGQNLTALKDGKAIITIKKDNAISYCSVVVGEGDFFIPRDNVYDTGTGFTSGNVRIGMLTGGDETLLSRLVDNKIRQVTKKASSYAYAKSSDSFSSKETSDGLFINLDTSKGGIRSTNSAQWDSMANAIAKSSNKNVFITAPSSIFGLNSFENKVIQDYLANCNKNVYVISGGDRNTYKNVDGVKYFTIANTKKSKLTVESLKNYNYLEISSGDSFSFGFKSVY